MRSQPFYVSACHSCVMYSAWNPKDNYDMRASFFKFNLMALCHSQVSLILQILTLQKPHIPASFNMYLVINKCVTAVKVSDFSGHYLRNR